MPDNGRMPSALPDGEAVPADGALPAHALSELGRGQRGILLHQGQNLGVKRVEFWCRHMCF